MAKTYIDFFETLKWEFIGGLKYKNRFLRYWGTTTIDGVPVLNRQRVVWPGTDDTNTKRLLKFLKMYDSIKTGSYDGLTSYYIYLNPTKADVLDQEDLDIILADKINDYVGSDGEVKVLLNFTDPSDPSKFKGYTKTQIVDYITSAYDTRFNTLNGSVISDYLIGETIGKYLLFDEGQHFTYTVTNASFSAIPYPVKVAGTSYIGDENGEIDKYVTRYKTGISIELIFTQTSQVLKDSNILIHILDEKNESLAQLLESSENELIDGSGDSIFGLKKVRVEKTDDVWYKGNMRVEFLNGPLKVKDKLKILFSSIDNGYTKKKVKRWKKLLIDWISINLIIGAVIVAAVTGQWWLVALAAGIVSGLQMVVAKNWGVEYGEYMGRWVKVANITAMVTGIGNLIYNIGKMAAREAAKQAMIEAGKSTAEASVSVAAMSTAEVAAFNVTVGAQAGLGSYISVAGDMLFSSMTSTWQSMVSTGFKVVNFTLKMISSNKMEAAQNEVNTLTEANAKVNKELDDITDKEVHIGVESIKWYTNSMTIDNQRFKVDYLYEGTKMNIGRPSFYTAKGHNIISDDIYDVNKV